MNADDIRYARNGDIDFAYEVLGSETLVSQTVRDLVAGSGLDFADRGAHDLKGVPGTWRVYAVA
jgi:class 3 adenylate cyclase